MIDTLIAAYGPFWGLLVPCIAPVVAAVVAFVIVTERRRS